MRGEGGRQNSRAGRDPPAPLGPGGAGCGAYLEVGNSQVVPHPAGSAPCSWTGCSNQEAGEGPGKAGGEGLGGSEGWELLADFQTHPGDSYTLAMVRKVKGSHCH